MSTSSKKPAATLRSPSVGQSAAPLVPSTTRIPVEVLEALTAVARQNGVPVSVLQRQALEDLVQAHLQTKPARKVTLEDLDKKLDVLLATQAQEAVQRRKLEAILGHLAAALGLTK